MSFIANPPPTPPSSKPPQPLVLIRPAARREWHEATYAPHYLYSDNGYPVNISQTDERHSKGIVVNGVKVRVTDRMGIERVILYFYHLYYYQEALTIYFLKAFNMKLSSVSNTSARHYIRPLSCFFKRLSFSKCIKNVGHLVIQFFL